MPRLSPRRAARYRASEEERLELPPSPSAPLPPFPLLLLSFLSSLAPLASSSSTASLDLLAAASTEASTLPSERLRKEVSSSPPAWSREEAVIASDPRAMEPSVAATAKAAVWLFWFGFFVFGFGLVGWFWLREEEGAV